MGARTKVRLSMDAPDLWEDGPIVPEIFTPFFFELRNFEIGEVEKWPKIGQNRDFGQFYLSGF